MVTDSRYPIRLIQRLCTLEASPNGGYSAGWYEAQPGTPFMDAVNGAIKTHERIILSEPPADGGRNAAMMNDRSPMGAEVSYVALASS